MSTPGWMSGLPALPIEQMRPSSTPMSALTMPQWSTISALVMTRSTAPWARALVPGHAVADRLAAAELRPLAVAERAVPRPRWNRPVAPRRRRRLGCGSCSTSDEQLVSVSAHAVAHGRAEHVGIGAARGQVRPCPVRPLSARAPVGQAAKTDRDRRFVPARQVDQLDRALLAGLEAHRRAGDVEPHAARGASRSKSSAPLVSAKW